MAEQAQETAEKDVEKEVEKVVIKPKVTIEDVGPARKCLTIEVPEDQINGKVEENYNQLNTDAVIPGFRKGHAPRKLIERRFSSAVRDDVRAQIISEAYSAAVEENKLDVLGDPDVKDHDNIKLPESGALTFKVEVEVSPEVKLPAFDAIELKKTKKPVTDQDVTEEIDRLAARYGASRQVETGEVQEKDFVEADVRILAGENAGEGADEISHQETTYIIVNGASQDFKGHVAGILVNDLGKTLTGKKVGDEVVVSQTGPQGHENEKIRSQPITIRIKIKKIDRVEPATVDELPAKLGYESVDQIKEQVRKGLEERREREQQLDLHKQVSDYLESKVELNLPEGMTSRQTERVLRRRAMEMAYAGSPKEEIESKMAEMREESEGEARKSLKMFFLIDQAAKDLKVDVSENEINSRIAYMAVQQGRRPEKLRQQMMRSGELEHVYLSIREQKTLDEIVGKAKVVEE